jgi:hypothetical protein
MDKRIIIAVIVAFVIVADALFLMGKSQNPPAGDSGVQGIVLLGPTCPVMRIDDNSCADRPYQADLTVLSADGSVDIARSKSGEDGRFKIALQPGDYILDAQAPGGNMLPRCGQTPVSVTNGVFVNMTISCDSGIR